MAMLDVRLSLILVAGAIGPLRGVGCKRAESGPAGDDLDVDEPARDDGDDAAEVL